MASETTVASQEELAELREWIVTVAHEAGDLTRSYFRSDLDIVTKDDATPVTRADREAELLIRSRIAERFPEDGILGEEFGTTAGTGRRTWVVDPIDGTKSFVAGVPLYAVLIGVVAGAFAGEEIDTRRVLAGVVHIPALHETVSAARGCGTLWQVDGRHDGRVASVASTEHLTGARIVTSDFADFARRQPGLFARVVDGGGVTRTWGDAYGYILVATGRMDAMVDPIVSPWDIAPLPVIVEEAGGCYTDLVGRPVLGTSALATTRRLHHELLPESALRPAAGGSAH